ncbi:hypothetical protein B0T24DRAFT_600801 [Lasiosphaeria ovina]|uniref:Uncharacterized protein n=1 Tax=Lasiosphaeria ovina TaxID=92902 RepID=A0AAE0NIV9_9PEZI|nr:hypothetical protein B0T24DRAFT_600801 [Lasiosphaeria ovina]
MALACPSLTTSTSFALPSRKNLITSPCRSLRAAMASSCSVLSAVLSSWRPSRSASRLLVSSVISSSCRSLSARRSRFSEARSPLSFTTTVECSSASLVCCCSACSSLSRSDWVVSRSTVSSRVLVASASCTCNSLTRLSCSALSCRRAFCSAASFCFESTVFFLCCSTALRSCSSARAAASRAAFSSLVFSSRSSTRAFSLLSSS